MRAWSNGKAVEIRSPYATRPWQHVLEPLSGYLKLAHKLMGDKKLDGESFNFGPQAENNFTVRQIIEDMSKFWGFEDKSKSYIMAKESSFLEAGLLKMKFGKRGHSFFYIVSL